MLILQVLAKVVKKIKITLPNYVLKVIPLFVIKVGLLMILLRNLDPLLALCNGTRLITHKLGTSVKRQKL